VLLDDLWPRWAAFAGLDGIMYLHFLRECVRLMAVLALVSLALLLPVDATGSRQRLAPNDTLRTVGTAVYTIANIAQDDAHDAMRFWAHVMSTLLHSALVYVWGYRLYRYVRSSVAIAM